MGGNTGASAECSLVLLERQWMGTTLSAPCMLTTLTRKPCSHQASAVNQSSVPWQKREAKAAPCCQSASKPSICTWPAWSGFVQSYVTPEIRRKGDVNDEISIRFCLLPVATLFDRIAVYCRQRAFRSSLCCQLELQLGV